MKDLAPDIVRQRLLIEGFFTTDVDKVVIGQTSSNASRVRCSFGPTTSRSCSPQEGKVAVRTRGTTRSCR